MDKTIFTSPGGFLKVKSAENTPYFYAERKGIDSIAFILLDKKNDKPYGVVYERKPPMDERHNGNFAFLETAFGGSNDIIDIETYEKMSKKEIISHMKKIVQLETKEEAGYEVSFDKISFISKDLVSTQMNQWAYLFLVDVTDIKQGETDPQNETEAMAKLVWKDLKGISEMNDWKAKSIIFSLLS